MTAHPTYLRLKAFLEERAVCRRASSPLGPGARVRILFTDHEGVYAFFHAPEGPRLEPAASGGQAPDFTLRLAPGLVEGLAALSSDDIGEYGVLLVSRGSSSDPGAHLGVTLHAGFKDLWRKGYFGILRLGGWPVMKALAARGLTNIGLIRQKVNENIRSEG